VAVKEVLVPFRSALLFGGVSLVGGVLLAQAPEERARRAETWGTSTGYTMIMNYRFQSANPDVTDPSYYYALVNGASQGSRCDGAPAAECLGYAQVHAPEGATLDGLDLWTYDNSDDADAHYALIENCDSPGGPVNTILDSGDLPGASGESHYAKSYDPPFPLNNAQCGYTLRLKLTDGGVPPQGPLIRIRKARVSWTRQVSPGPATATFNDVPTSHPFFQFVEALAKSGITGGCNAAPPLYCPDAPLTRGQMAVFLAKALGLQWP
jgi:hypothetical protein